MLKKILLMSCALLALVGATVVHAAPRITKVAYGVSPDRQLRVVLETTTPARMRSEFIEKELGHKINMVSNGPEREAIIYR